MRITKVLPVLMLAVCLTGLSAISALAQTTYRAPDWQMKQLLTSIDNRSNAFRSSLQDGLNHSSLNGTRREDTINKQAADLKRSVDHLKQDFDAHRSTRMDAEVVLSRAQVLNTFMHNHRLNSVAQSDWQSLRADLNQLASDYYVAWRWDQPASNQSASWPNRMGQTRTRNLIDRLATRTGMFSKDMPSALNRSSLNGTAHETEINRMVTDLAYATDRLQQRFNDRTSTPTDVETVLQRAAPINDVMLHNNFNYQAEHEWQMLKSDLDQIASAYNVAWNWNAPPVMDSSALHLTGTYRLNAALSDNPRIMADRVIQNSGLSYSERESITNNVVSRLNPPETIAIDRDGNQVTLASTRSPQVTFEANGSGNVALYPDGRASHVQITLVGDQLKVASTGYQPNKFDATFEPTDHGERLLVTRDVYAERLNSPIVVRSYYDRISDVAQLDIFGPGYGDKVSGDFIVADGTTMTAVLNDDLNTKTAIDNERFTMTASNPYQDRGAIIEGYVSAVDRGERFSGRPSMTLNFDRIRMPDGRTYDFAGTLENVQPPNGEEIRIDNEGSVAAQNSQTKTTLERTAIGSAVGALIGAVAGGGKGVAIGTVVGAGAGAGSVYVEGRNNLDLSSGSQLTILASAPMRP